MHGGEGELAGAALQMVPWLLGLIVALLAFIGKEQFKKQNEHAKGIADIGTSMARIEAALGGSLADLDRRVTRLEAVQDRAAIEADLINGNGGLSHG